jgi:cytochrome b pre-mRNA-processing protein 3
LAGFLAPLRRRSFERTGYELYGRAVGAARDPWLYTDIGVPDTLDGRFDAIGLYAFLAIDRLSRDAPPGPEAAQALFDAMFRDMDINLREMGVGDLSVGRKVKEMWEAFHGRAKAYSAPVAAGDADALAQALARNVWRGAEPPPGAPARLARIALAQARTLAAQPLGELARGRVRFLPAREAEA